MASTAQNPFGKKRFNSQAKYLIMKLWEYFEQEAKKCHVAVNVKNKVSKAFGMDSLASMRNKICTFRDFNRINYES